MGTDAYAAGYSRDSLRSGARRTLSEPEPPFARPRSSDGREASPLDRVGSPAAREPSPALELSVLPASPLARVPSYGGAYGWPGYPGPGGYP